MIDRPPRRSLFALALVPIVAALGLAMTLPIRHDYSLYVTIWWRIRHGGDPWLSDDGQFQDNAYGPIFNLFALPYAWHAALPRALFVLAYAAVALALLRRFGTDGRRFAALAAVLFGNGLFWISGVTYGQTDLLCAPLALVGVWLVDSGRPALAGASLALGALTKIYPAFLAPFLGWSRGRPDGRFWAGFLVTLGAGAGLAWLVWGPTVLVPITYAAERESKLLSLFYFLRGEYSPLRRMGMIGDLDRFSAPALLLGLAGTFALHLWFRFRPAFSAALAAVVVFTLYKVGHLQFHVLPLLLLVLWWGRETSEGASARLPAAWAAYGLWFGLLPFAYATADHFTGNWAFVREAIGLPSFLIQAWLVVTLARKGLTDPRCRESAAPEWARE